MAERFHVNLPLAPGRVELTGAEAHHLATVCRLRPGDVACLFNGDGRQYPAEVIEAARRHVVLEVRGVEATDREVGFRLEVAAPLPKGDRAQFLVEKLTELGATAFTPLVTARTVVLPHGAKLERLQRHVIEASKQCGRNVLLEVRPLCPWNAFLQGTLPARRLLAHPSGMQTGCNLQSANCNLQSKDVVLAVGPEGGFTDEEAAAARDAGWTVVSLGPRTLRVETAAILLTALLVGGA